MRLVPGNLRTSPPPASPAVLPLVPPGTPAWITPELLLKTIRVWSPRYRENLTSERAVAILLNAGKLFDALRSFE